MARVRKRGVGLPAMLGLGVLSVYLLSASSDLKHNGDTDLRYQTTQAIVDHGRLWIANPMWTDTRVARGIGGHLYAFYAPGQALMMAPLYVLGKAAAHHFGLPYDIATLYASRSLDLFLGALLAVLFFCFAVRLGYSRRVAAIVTLIFVFATAAWPDAQSALEQTPVDLFVLAAIFSLWSWIRSEMRSSRWLVACGAGLGAAMCTRYDAALYVPVVAGLVLGFKWKADGLRRALLAVGSLVTAVLPWLAALAAWNLARFGSPFLTGLHEQTFGGNPVAGFLGLTVSPGKGLIWYVPVFLVLPWAFPAFRRRTDSGATIFAAMALAPIVFYSAILFWHGDPSWGPRYIFPALPYLTMPLAEILSSWRSRALSIRMAFVALVGLSLMLQLAAVSVTQWRFWYRLEAQQQRTAVPSAWSGQPFRWGASHYHYYWNVRQSPILFQFDDVYQVARLAISGDAAYRLTAQPDPWVHSNPASDYPVNTFAFWWDDPLHPLFSAKTRDAAAIILGLSALFFLAGIGMSAGPTRPRSGRNLTDATARAARSAGG